MTELPRLRSPWLRDPAARRLFDALGRTGRQSRFVGGAVRDAILDDQADNHDLDVATQARPEEAMVLLQDAGIKVIPTGLRHGTITALVDGGRFEVTTLRRDVQTDGRHAVVEFTDDFVVDAARRDFTFNALSCSLDGTVFDPFDGVSDLKAGRVRFIGEPDLRIREDYLRILRFFRFLARLGQEPPDLAALAACVRHRDGLKSLAAERIWSELSRILVEQRAVLSIKLMEQSGIWRLIVPYQPDLASLRRLHEFGIAPGPILSLAVLLSLSRRFSRPEAESLGASLKLSRRERSQLLLLLTEELPDELDDFDSLRRWSYVRNMPLREAADFLTLIWVRRDGDPTALVKILAAASASSRPVLPITGNDFISRGIDPGPALGNIKRQVEAAWVDSNFSLDRSGCLALLDRLVVGRLDKHPFEQR
ncbi:poly(A) polymerase [Arboricoccus pini]|uniref:Poly(A) polymerase n=1 Tax=Arboricoccus pini TaxID=1963835 RepID=A0A212R0N7_9PROT|nr:CCA tRNA nucleotidyltransferase [Arboricoccus pini]SNB65400.1 poly(A) polymerase [Arboricoccus pini]